MNHTLGLTHNLIMLAGVFMQIGHAYYKDASQHHTHYNSEPFVNSIVISRGFLLSSVMSGVALMVRREKYTCFVGKMPLPVYAQRRLFPFLEIRCFITHKVSQK